MLVVASVMAETLTAEIAGAWPASLAPAINQFDGQFLDHPWAPPNATRPGAARTPDDNQVRVPVEILDRLFGRIGEFFNISSALNVLVVDSQVPGVLQRLNDHIVMTAPALLPAMDVLQRQQTDLAQIEAEVHRLVSLIHEATLGLRVIPLDVLFSRYPRMIRDLAKEQGKQIRFETQSNGIKVDKGMTELLGDPLMHILRNSVDHGVESAEQREASGKPAAARITLTAVQSGNRVAVEIVDDGRGIDAERVRRQAVAQNLVTESDSHKLSKDQIHRFIFAPGFSTAEAVTDTSGRGVGMDVALVNISRLGGRIDIQTVPGQGTTFRLDMPLSAAMQTVLLAETAVQTVAFPERMVVEAVTVTDDQVQYVNGQRALLLHDRFLPLFRLTDLLRLPEAANAIPETRSAEGPTSQSQSSQGQTSHGHTPENQTAHGNAPEGQTGHGQMGHGQTGPGQSPDSQHPQAQTGADLSLIIVAADHTRYGVEVNRILRRHEMLIRETHPRIAQLPGNRRGIDAWHRPHRSGDRPRRPDRPRPPRRAARTTRRGQSGTLMRFGHLLVRCGPHRILVPGDNVAAIEEGSDVLVKSISIRRAMRSGWTMVLDTRILLGLDPTGRASPRVHIHWHSHDGRRRAMLGVDGVEGLRHDDDADVLPLPRVPAVFRALFDGLVHGDGDAFLLRLRHDVCPAFDTVSHRRGFVSAMMGASAPANLANNVET